MWILSYPFICFHYRKYLNVKFLQAAKEAKALEAAKINLEKQVEELNLCLESEKRMRVMYLFIVNENAQLWNKAPQVY